jgi:hypothetical protein
MANAMRVGDHLMERLGVSATAVPEQAAARDVTSGAVR